MPPPRNYVIDVSPIGLYALTPDCERVCGDPDTALKLTKSAAAAIVAIKRSESNPHPGIRVVPLSEARAAFIEFKKAQVARARRPKSKA